MRPRRQSLMIPAIPHPHLVHTRSLERITTRNFLRLPLLEQQMPAPVRASIYFALCRRWTKVSAVEACPCLGAERPGGRSRGLDGGTLGGEEVLVCDRNSPVAAVAVLVEALAAYCLAADAACNVRTGRQVDKLTGTDADVAELRRLDYFVAARRSCWLRRAGGGGRRWLGGDGGAKGGVCWRGMREMQ